MKLSGPSIRQDYKTVYGNTSGKKDILNQEEGLHLSKIWLIALRLCNMPDSPLRGGGTAEP